MAISHLCLSCGFDLARTPARPDPYYALPIAICPDCGEAAVRRMHPMRRGWRTLLRVETSVVTLAFQLALLIGFTSLVVAVCVFVGERWASGDLNAFWGVEKILTPLFFGALPVALGIWLTAGLGHLRSLYVWPAFAILILMLISLDCVGEPLVGRGLLACGLSIKPVEFFWDQFAVRLITLVAIMAIAVAGIPPGLLARAGERRWRRNRWRARRRRLRKRRTGR
jgi:hypothetical protein